LPVINLNKGGDYVLKVSLPKFNGKVLIYVVSALVAVSLVGGAVYAAFADKGEVKGVTISVGSADIKLLSDLSGGVDTTNLSDSIQGPSFSNIGQTWTADFPVKVYNNATSGIVLSSISVYETANDPSDLRSYIYVEALGWVDTDGNGTADPSEIQNSYGKKTIVKWKTEGLDLGSVDSGQIKGLVFRFSTQNLSSTKQGATLSFDFELNGVALD
jgi:hypothetical protein